jgi:hypothetical protein
MGKMPGIVQRMLSTRICLPTLPSVIDNPEYIAGDLDYKREIYSLSVRYRVEIAEYAHTEMGRSREKQARRHDSPLPDRADVTKPGF